MTANWQRSASHHTLNNPRPQAMQSTRFSKCSTSSPTSRASSNTCDITKSSRQAWKECSGATRGARWWKGGAAILGRRAGVCRPRYAAQGRVCRANSKGGRELLGNREGIAGQLRGIAGRVCKVGGNCMANERGLQGKFVRREGIAGHVRKVGGNCRAIERELHGE